MTHLNCKSKLLFSILILCASSRFVVTTARGSSPIKMIVRMMNANQDSHDGHQHANPSPQDCADSASLSSRLDDDHATSMELDSTWDWKDFFDTHSMDKLMVFDKLDHDSRVLHEPEQHFTNEDIIGDNDSGAQQQDSDCPETSDSSEKSLNHGLLIVGKKGLQLKPHLLPQAKATTPVSHQHVKSKSKITPYSKAALTEKRKQLADKFPIKSSKLITVERQQLAGVLSQEKSQLQTEQKKNSDIINQEPVLVKSIIPNNNLETRSEQVFQEQQQQQKQQQQQQQTGLVLDNRTLSNPINTTRSQADNSTDLTAGMFDDGFETSTQSAWESYKQPIGIVQGQRARDSFLLASNIARSLKMKSLKPT